MLEFFGCNFSVIWNILKWRKFKIISTVRRLEVTVRRRKKFIR